MQEFSALDNFGILFKLAGTFEKGETVTVRGSEATVYSGTVQGADIKALVSSTGVLDSLQEQLEVDLEDAALQLDDLGSMPVSIAIDNKSGMITRYTMDLTELMRKLMPLVMDQAMAAVAEEAGPEGLDPRRGQTGAGSGRTGGVNPTQKGTCSHLSRGLLLS